VDYVRDLLMKCIREQKRLQRVSAIGENFKGTGIIMITPSLCGFSLSFPAMGTALRAGKEDGCTGSRYSSAQT